MSVRDVLTHELLGLAAVRWGPAGGWAPPASTPLSMQTRPDASAGRQLLSISVLQWAGLAHPSALADCQLLLLRILVCTFGLVKAVGAHDALGIFTCHFFWACLGLQ